MGGEDGSEGTRSQTQREGEKGKDALTFFMARSKVERLIQ